MSQKTLFFAHANGFPMGSYRKLLEQLTPYYTVQGIDRIGHDPRFPVTNNWLKLKDELLWHLRQQTTPVIGVGHSLGGMLTYMAALEQPELFQRIVLLDVPLLTRWEEWFLRLAKRSGWIDRLTPAGRTVARRRHWSSAEEAFKWFRQKPTFAAFDEDCLRDYIAAGTVNSASGIELSFDPAIELAVYRTLPHHLSRYCRQLKVPVTVICGLQSDTVRPYQRRAMAKRSGVKVEVVDGGHLFPLEQPVLTAEYILQAIRQGEQGVAA
ncbi:alpha/beta fold hydrolase [Balneatrix alpica]|uniref:alpha/beta fold hydrolase n=1 Tax=Balneatrix alpica TaxID=75684 RepID=UPI0027383597|nr:alpha/beta hydrolase [Balneatrix alpica]